MERMAEDLSRYLRGWIGYFGKCETPSVLEGLEQWFRRRFGLRWLPEVNINRCRVAAEIQRIVPEPVDVTGLIGTEDCQNFIADLMAVCFHSPNGTGHCHEIMKDEQIGYQVIVFNELALLLADVLRDN